jgi:hypothetical protein
LKKSNTDKLLASFVTPYTDIELPSRMFFLKLSIDPHCR